MNADFVKAIAQLGAEKGILPEVLYSAVEEALITAYKKNFGSSQKVRVTLNKDNGEMHVFARKTVVENVADSTQELSLEAARKINANYQLEDIIEEEVTPKDFGRIAAQTAKQVVVQRLKEAERGIIYDEYAAKEGDIVTGMIHRVERAEQKNVYLEIGKTEAVLMPSEQIPHEVYKPGERLKCYLLEVKKTNKGPQILVSRTHPGLLKRLFELEVPEIHDGFVEIRSVSREAGARSKIAVYSRDENIDPVGSCVGPKGSRVQNVVNELRGEKVDIVKWDEDPAVYIANALSPSKVVSVEVFEDEKASRVVVPDYQLSLAIGKEGQNARLAAKLTGWKIDIKSEAQL